MAKDDDIGRGDDRFMRGAADREQPQWKNRKVSGGARRKGDSLVSKIVKVFRGK